MFDVAAGWRAAGILFPITALPSKFGIGDLGPGAYNFVNFLEKSEQHFWQILPLGPTSESMYYSPYATSSAFAGNPLLISPTIMQEMDLLSAAELSKLEKISAGDPLGTVNYKKATLIKEQALIWAFKKIKEKLLSDKDFATFCKENAPWLNDYAFFTAAKTHFSQKSWLDWPKELQQRQESALQQYGLKLNEPILLEKFKQFVFFKQLELLKKKLAEAKIGLIGDAPIYVQHDSSDVWANQYLFKLDADGLPEAVSGVPPDYFAKDGQLWGHPVFNWKRNHDDGFNWWIRRVKHNFGLFDLLRLDHFRAFAKYWEVPKNSLTAAVGKWVPGPGAPLFQSILNETGKLPIIAEDLGFITPDVTILRKKFNLLGTRVLQFGFGNSFASSSNASFRIEEDNAIYVGTHDNNTTRGWFRKDISGETKTQISKFLDRTINESTVAWQLIKIAYLSNAALAISSIWDLLNLNEKDRFNTPGTVIDNWSWQMTPNQAATFYKIANRLKDLTKLSGRDNKKYPNILTYN